MRSLAGLDEADLPNASPSTTWTPSAIMSATKKSLAVGRGANVLRHALPRRADDLVLAVGPLDDLGRPAGLDHLRVAQHLAVDEIDLGDGAGELAGEDRVTAVDREIRVIDARAARHVDRVLELHRLRIAEVEPLHRFGDDDRRFAVGREIHVVGIVDRDRFAGLAGLRIDRRKAAALRVLRVVGDPQRARSYDGTTCCGFRPTLNLSTTLRSPDRSRRRRCDCRFGTYTRGRSPATAGLSLPAAVSL